MFEKRWLHGRVAKSPFVISLPVIGNPYRRTSRSVTRFGPYGRRKLKMHAEWFRVGEEDFYLGDDKMLRSADSAGAFVKETSEVFGS